jgi:hypothetical protein
VVLLLIWYAFSEPCRSLLASRVVRLIVVVRVVVRVVAADATWTFG